MPNDTAAGLEKPATHWRLAFMFDAAGGDRAELGRKLTAASATIQTVANGGSVRFGVAEHFMNEGEDRDGHEFSAWRRNDGAIEITVPASEADRLPDIAAAMRPVLEPLAAPDSVEVMAGPVYFMVPTRPGGKSVLSLAFKRDPATTKEQFSRWWFHQHSQVAIPVLGENLLSYDQVHCDDAMTLAVSKAYGSEPYYYDAYDNLSWANWDAYIESVSDPEGSQNIAADEIRRIDNDTRRHAMLVSLSDG